MPRLHNSRVTALVEFADGGMESGVQIFRCQSRPGAQTGVAVEPRGGGGGFERWETLREEPSAEAGEDVACTGGGEEGAGVRVDRGAAVWGCDDGVGAFEEDDGVDLSGGGADGFDAVEGGGEEAGEQAFELAGVWGEDCGGGED